MSTAAGLAVMMEEGNRRLAALMAPMEEAVDRMFCTLAAGYFCIFVLQDFIDWIDGLSVPEEAVPPRVAQPPLSP